MNSSFYETDEAVEQYLLFHYGTFEQTCPLLPEARMAYGFPFRCVSEPLQYATLARKARALDLGCGVGRGSFELGRHFDEVLGIDFSRRFVTAAQHMGEKRTATIRAHREGLVQDEIHLELPPDLRSGHVHFEQGDAGNLRPDLGAFDLILLANLIDRLPDPRACLARLPQLVSPGGWLIITSPYTWLEEYTPRDRWLDDEGRGTLSALKKILSPAFALRHVFDLPFLIREHRRKFQLSVAEVSIWQSLR